MANTHWGVEGVVKLGSNVVGEMQQWSFEQTQEPVEDTAMGDTDRTYIINSGLKAWTAQIEVAWDETDTNGQEALTIGAGVTLNLGPEGFSTGDVYYSGAAIVESVGLAVQKDALIMRKYTLRGNGALTRTVAP